MKERSERLKAIRQIVREHRIGSQETLLKHLRDHGFSVTQATLSRDLKALRVGKVSDGAHGYYYTLPTEEERRENERNYASDIRRGFLNVDFSANIAVVRTITGHADTVAIALDNMGIECVMGTVAGDDTVFVLMREGTKPAAMVAALQQKVPEIEV